MFSIEFSLTPFSGYIKVFYLFNNENRLVAATFPSAIFFIIGEICPIDDPPTKKQKNVEIIVGESY